MVTINYLCDVCNLLWLDRRIVGYEMKIKLPLLLLSILIHDEV